MDYRSLFYILLWNQQWISSDFVPCVWNIDRRRERKMLPILSAFTYGVTRSAHFQQLPLEINDREHMNPEIGCSWIQRGAPWTDGLRNINLFLFCCKRSIVTMALWDFWGKLLKAGDWGVCWLDTKQRASDLFSSTLRPIFKRMHFHTLCFIICPADRPKRGFSLQIWSVWQDPKSSMKLFR